MNRHPSDYYFQMMIHAEEMAWQRFGSLLTANSILLLAIVTLLPLRSSSVPFIGPLIVVLALLGAGFSLASSAHNIRSRMFLDAYIEAGRELEKNGAGVFTLTDLLRRSLLPFGKTGGWYSLPLAPLGFAVAYAFALLAAVWWPIALVLDFMIIIPAVWIMVRWDEITREREKRAPAGSSGS